MKEGMRKSISIILASLFCVAGLVYIIGTGIAEERHVPTRFTVEVIPNRAIDADGYQIVWLGFRGGPLGYSRMFDGIDFDMDENHSMRYTANRPETLKIELIYYKNVEVGSNGKALVRVATETRSYDFVPYRK